MVFILYGKKDVVKTIGSGEFSCPNCTSDQPYWHKSLQEKGHLYFISVLKIGDQMEFVECRTCEEVYQPDVLDFKPGVEGAHYASDFELLVRRLMVLMMLADGTADDSEIAMLIDIYDDVFGHRPDPDEIRAEAEDVAAMGASVADYAAILAEILTDDAKALIIEVVFMIAAADDSIDQSELDVVGEIAAHLNMTHAQVGDVLDALEQEA